MSGYTIKFLDGPAQKEEIETLIEPQAVRWFCVSELSGGTVRSWWAMEEPPVDPGVRITRYRIIGTAPRLDGSYLVAYEVDDAAPTA